MTQKLTLEKIKQEWIPGETEFWDGSKKLTYCGVFDGAICGYLESHDIWTFKGFCISELKTTPPEEERWIWLHEKEICGGFITTFEETACFYTESEVKAILDRGGWKRAKKLRKMEPWD